MTPARSLRPALSHTPSPLVFAAAGSVLAEATVGGVTEGVAGVADALEDGLMALVYARDAAEALRVDVAAAGATLALVRPGVRRTVLGQLPGLLGALPPPDWAGDRATVLRRAVVELLAGRPVAARRCARALAVRGEPDAARWLRIAADLVERGYPALDLASGLRASVRSPAVLTDDTIAAARLLRDLGRRAPVPVGAPAAPPRRALAAAG